MVDSGHLGELVKEEARLTREMIAAKSIERKNELMEKLRKVSSEITEILGSAVEDEDRDVPPYSKQSFEFEF
jgi:hypothetical protein